MQENKSILLLALNIDNLLHELIEPILKRTLKIILRNMPIVEKDDVAFYDEEIRYVDEIHLELNSVFVKRLNAYIQAEGLQSSLQTLQMLYSISPDSIQAVDTDNYARLLLASSGLPATLIKSEEELQKQREEMAKLQQMQLEMQQRMANAQTNVDNAKAQSLLGQGQE